MYVSPLTGKTNRADNGGILDSFGVREHMAMQGEPEQHHHQ